MQFMQNNGRTASSGFLLARARIINMRNETCAATKNFKGSDTSGSSVYFLFCAILQHLTFCNKAMFIMSILYHLPTESAQLFYLRLKTMNIKLQCFVRAKQDLGAVFRMTKIVAFSMI